MPADTPSFRPQLKRLVVACVVLGASAGQPALASPPGNADAAELMRLLKKMNARLNQLEKRNTELEQRLAERSATTEAATSATLEKRIVTLEQAREAIAQGLASDRISEKEPELTARLKAAEMDALDTKKAARKIDALDGLSVEAALTTVAQRPSGLPQGNEGNISQLGYRADVTATLPLDAFGNAEQKLFAHFRLGQNAGLNTPLGNLGTFAGATNATAFHASGAVADDAPPMLGQAWYQAAIPLPFGGFQPASRETLELTFGKMDIFGFFDQNEAAGDEARQFLNVAFVHNPLLDAGGQVGADGNGFQPGVIAAYVNERSKPETWRLSLGAFGTRRSANYQRSFSSPLLMAQAEASIKILGGLTGNYRIYAWRNGQGAELDGSSAAHAGWGISADQRLGDGITLFGRYGHQARGAVTFDRAITLGSEVSGSPWNRGGDVLGMAYGHLRASSEFRASGGSGDIIGDGTGAFAYAPGTAEQVAEIYYRWRITGQFELSPDLQMIRKAGANPDARNIRVLGLRAQVAF